MKTGLVRVLCGGIALALLGIGGTYFYLLALNPEPTLLQADSRIEDVKIQPQTALKLAQPHLAKHGTYRWHKDRPLKTYIVRQQGWFSDSYFIRRHNYPAKTHRYHLNKAVKVDPQSGKVSWTSQAD
jgi:hypothetical protein